MLSLRFRAGGPGLLALLLGLGCGSSLPPLTDPGQARATLQTALDAWQKGTPLEELKRQEPPVYFTDLDCREGKRLVAYKLAEGHERHGQGVRLTVALKLAGKDGALAEKKTTYLVDRGEAIVIVPY
jgi:hypothetical protein